MRLIKVWGFRSLLTVPTGLVVAFVRRGQATGPAKQSSGVGQSSGANLSSGATARDYSAGLLGETVRLGEPTTSVLLPFVVRSRSDYPTHE